LKTGSDILQPYNFKYNPIDFFGKGAKFNFNDKIVDNNEKNIFSCLADLPLS